MPELPDIELYRASLQERIIGQPLNRIRITSPFLLRTFDPPVEAAERRMVRNVRRLGKRIVLELEGELFLVFHLMIAGRFRWNPKGEKARGKIVLATFEFPTGMLLLTEAGTKKRASLYVVRGEEWLRAHNPGGAEPLDIDAARFGEILRRENHTLKRALTDPRLFAGIGNAYSDEILHAAGLSPVTLTSKVSPDDAKRLHAAMQRVLREWTERLHAEFADRFPGPGDVTAFRKGFAVHGRYGKSCPVCDTAVQRIRYADNETNYCPRCQTGGRVLADRSLSRLLREDWPRRIEQLEEGT